MDEKRNNNIHSEEEIFNTSAEDLHQQKLNQDKASNQIWLISYSDFMTILMIFFLGMYGYTVLTKAKLIEMQKDSISYSEFAQMASKLKSNWGENIELQEDVSKVVIHLPETILFQSGKSNLSGRALSTLEELAGSLKLVEGDIVVEGHTDNVPIKSSTYKSNWELSVARSLSVVEALEQFGIQSERMAAWGFGENRPNHPNTTSDLRAKNRRIEVVLLKNTKSKESKTYGG